MNTTTKTDGGIPPLSNIKDYFDKKETYYRNEIAGDEDLLMKANSSAERRRVVAKQAQEKLSGLGSNNLRLEIKFGKDGSVLEITGNGQTVVISAWTFGLQKGIAVDNRMVET